MIYQKLAWLNDLPEAEAIEVFVECSGSPEWSRAMTDARPFPMLEQLYSRAELLWSGDGFHEIEKKLNALLER